MGSKLVNKINILTPQESVSIEIKCPFPDVLHI